MIEVRPFRIDDLAAMLEVRRDSIVNVASRDYPQTQIAEWAGRLSTYEKQLERFAKSLTWVAATDEKIVGYSNLEADGHLDTMFVHSGFLRRGVATALLQAVESAALSSGLPRLYSEVSFTARPFFQKNVFRIASRKQVTFDDGSSYGFRMEKAL